MMSEAIRKYIVLLMVVVVGMTAFAGGRAESSDSSQSGSMSPQSSAGPIDLDGLETAVFAGGCFWCMEEAFEKFDGVAEAVSGYAGGEESNPTYNQVAGKQTGHTEVIRVYYDPAVISYEDLLYVFWRNVDLLDGGGQFCDRGSSYRPEIFYETDEQLRQAEQSKSELQASGLFNREIATRISPLDVILDDDNDGFWIAEDYHQGYYQTNAVRYQLYKEACGRVRRLVQLWGDQAGGVLLDS